jgi:DNA polymerase-3 subunit beta
LFAAGPGCRRYCLEGVLCEVEPGLFRLVASDNRRLAVAQMAADGSCAGPGGVLPARAVALLARLASEAEAPVEAVFGPARAWFRTSAAALSARVVEGNYPPWRSGVPASPPCCLEVPVAGLLSAVRQAAVLREQVGARLVLRLEPGRLVLESGRAGAGQSRVARKVLVQGGPVKVALQPRFLVELLRCLEGEETVRLGLTDADTPVLFRSGDYTHVLMPLVAR